MIEKQPISYNRFIDNWWSQRRLRYNIGLIVAGIIAFILYAILGEILIAPHDINFEVTLFTTAFQGIGYLIMIGLANLMYFLGPLFDKLFNKRNNERFRKTLFEVGFWFSVALPFTIPVIIVSNTLRYIQNNTR